mgnify:CR=1 FL=1
MFFETNDFSISSISAFKFCWGTKVAVSAVRPYHALSFRIKGNAKFIHEEDIIPVKTGDIVFVPAFYNYTLDSGDEEVCVIHFECDRKLPQKIKKFTPEATSYYEKRFDELYNVWSKKQLGFEYECKSIFYRIVMHIEKDLANSKTDLTNNKILRTTEYIHENFTDQSLTVEKLANYSNISETYFRNLFKQQYNLSPSQYIINVRLQKAKSLMSYPFLTLEDCALQSGFSSLQYFCRIFKKITGMTPAEYRKQK